MLYLLYLVGALLIPGAFPIGCGPAEQPAPLSAADGELSALPTPELSPITPAAEHEAAPIQASGNGSQDVAVSMDPPDDELPDDGNAPVLSSWVANLPGGSAPENMVLMTPLNLVAGDAGNEEQVRLRWSVESANQLAFMIQRQQWWGEQWIDSDLIVAPPFPYTHTDSPGAGLWRYAIAAANTDGMSPPTEWSQVRVDSSWTTFTPSADTRIVYVSSSEGNDSNNGLSTLTPKATIAAGYALLRNGYPDWLLLKRGDVWENQSLGHWRKSGRSATEMMVVNTYGDAMARPLLRTGTNGGLSRVQGGGSPLQVDHVAIVGVHLLAHTRSATTHVAGILLLDGGDNWLFEDCKIERYSPNITVQSFRGLFRQVRFFRCIVVDAYLTGGHSQGLYAEGIEGLEITECVFDHNGHMPLLADPTIFNHNVYIQASTVGAVLRNNIFARASSHGAQVRGGGEVSGCLFLRNPIALLVGGGDLVTPGGVIVDVRDNIILEGTDISDALPRGFGIDFKNVASGVVTNNIVANKLATNPYAFGIGSWVSGGPPGVGLQNLTVEDNVVFNWRGGARFNNQAPASYTNFRFRNNVLHTSNPNDTAPLVDASTALDGIAFSGNRYFSTATSTPFRNNGSNITFAAWQAAAGEAASTLQSTSFSDPTRSLEMYYSELTGMSETFETAIQVLRSQSRHNWDTRLEAGQIRAYLAAGFEVTN